LKGGQPNKPQAVPDPANLSQAELSSNEQATVIPWFCGERKFAVAWISPIYNLFSKDGNASSKK
jgi:hypothetical protein